MRYVDKIELPRAGFTLIEVLVTLLVLSIGLLGLAALQTFGFRYTQQSYQRTQAVYQAYDVADRIRANPGGKNNGCYDTIAAGVKQATGACGGAVTNCESTPCTPSQLANYDVNNWNTANEQLLAEGQGQISIIPTPPVGTAPRRAVISILWKEDGFPRQFDLQIDI